MSMFAKDQVLPMVLERNGFYFPTDLYSGDLIIYLIAGEMPSLCGVFDVPKVRWDLIALPWDVCIITLFRQ